MPTTQRSKCAALASSYVALRRDLASSKSRSRETREQRAASLTRTTEKKIVTHAFCDFHICRIVQNIDDVEQILSSFACEAMTDAVCHR